MSNLKIGIDGTFLEENFDKTGIGGFLIQLINGFLRQEEKNIILFVNNNILEYAKQILPDINIVGINILNVPKLGRIFVLIDLYKKLKQNKIDIFFDPYTRLGSLLNSPCKRISVVHDLHFKYYPQCYNLIKLKVIKIWIKEVIRNTDEIVAISKWTKDDILREYGDIKNISVIGNPVEIKKYDGYSNTEILNLKPYILCVNSFHFWKNQETLIYAFDKIKEQIPHNLILIGNGDYNRLNKIIKKLKLTDRIRIKQNIDEKELYYYYKQAELFVNTSLFEGFGRGNIEAGLLNIPVLSSREMCLEEVSLGLLNYYEPATDSNALSYAISNVLKICRCEETLKEIGIIFNNMYNITTITKKYLQIIHKLNE